MTWCLVSIKDLAWSQKFKSIGGSYSRLYSDIHIPNIYEHLDLFGAIIQLFEQVLSDITRCLPCLLIASCIPSIVANIPQFAPTRVGYISHTWSRNVSIIFKPDSCLANRNWLVLFAPPPKRWSSNILTDAIVNYCSIFLRATTPLWFVAGGDLKPYPNDPKCISLLELDGIGVITCNGPRHVYLTDIVYLSFPQVEVVNPTKNSINLINPTYIH